MSEQEPAIIILPPRSTEPDGSHAAFVRVLALLLIELAGEEVPVVQSPASERKAS